MSRVTVSPKFQVIIPKDDRDALGIRPGMEVEVIRRGRALEYVPIRPLKSYRGLFKGANTSDYRDEDDGR